MFTALAPLQTGIEQLWSHVVEQFRTTLEKVTRTYTAVLQSERDKVIRAEARVKELESVNMKMLEQRCMLGEKMASLEKQLEELKETVKNQNDALIASQREMGMLAGEKGRLEVEISSLRNVGRQVADSGIQPSTQLVSILLQQEIANQIEKKLRDAHQEVEEHAIARQKVEKQLNGMKDKLKAVSSACSRFPCFYSRFFLQLVGYDIGELEKRSSMSPGRETSTVVGTPPPKSSYHSRRPSNDMTLSSPTVTPLIPSSLPPSSVPTSPVVLRAAPPLERRPSPRPQLPTPPTTAAAPKPSIAGNGAQDETARSFSVPPRPNVIRSATTPVVVPGVEASGCGIGLKRSRSAAGRDPGEPAPVRRLTVESEGPRREGLQSRGGSRGPHVPAPPIASIASDGTVNEDGPAMEIDTHQQPVVSSPEVPEQRESSTAPEDVSEAKFDDAKEDPPMDCLNPPMGSLDDGKEDGEEEEQVRVKLEDEIDQLMDELVSYDDELEEGEVMDTEGVAVEPVSEEKKPLDTESVLRPPTPVTSSPAPPHQPSPALPASSSAAPSSFYVPPARSWAQAYPGRPVAAASVKEEQIAKLPPGPPKLSVSKHWDLLYLDDGAQWKCRLCQ